MGHPQFVDISAFQPSQIDWPAYRAWSAQGDGISRVAIRSSYGTGYVDTNYHNYCANAISAGIDVIIHYHYSYPQYNTAIDEANWQKQVVGDLTARPNDIIILDFEENVDAATPDWAYNWLTQQQANYGQRVGIYSYASFIAFHLQDSRLSRFPLWYANWTFDPNSQPIPPQPWTRYEWLQYADNASNIPGINAVVDVDIFIGGNIMGIPTGWSDDGTTLTAPNGVPMVLGFRQYVLSQPSWDANNVPLRPEYGASPAQLHRPDLGLGTRQELREGLLWWTKNTGVIYEGQIGLELVPLYDSLARPTIPAIIQSDIAVVKAAADKLTLDAQ